MNKFRLFMIVSALFFISLSVAKAQVGISININSQPLWGPVAYDYVEYYYLPEYDVYYNAPKAQFVYLNGPNWVFAPNLPSRYQNVNLYRTYKVVINEPTPYLRHDYYYGHYKKYKNVHSKQGNIRESKDPKYARGNSHPGNSKNGRMVNQGGKSMQHSSDKGGRNENHKGNEGDKGSKGNKGNKGNKGH